MKVNDNFFLGYPLTPFLQESKKNETDCIRETEGSHVSFNMEEAAN